jgi:hypothetical protein
MNLIEYHAKNSRSAEEAATLVAEQMDALVIRLPHIAPPIPGLTSELATAIVGRMKAYRAAVGEEANDSRGNRYLKL